MSAEIRLDRWGALALGVTDTLVLLALGVDWTVAGRDATLQQHLDRSSARYVRGVLSEAGGKRVEAARRLGIDRTTLYRLMRRYGIDESE